MTQNQKKSNYFTFKNYAYLIGTILLFALICWYFISWYNVKQEEKLQNSFLISSNTITYELASVDEAPLVLQEAPNEYFIYISYTGDESIYKLEKNLKKVIDNYVLKDEFYYLNVSENIEDDDLFKKLNKTFKTDKIDSLPCILYYKEGKLIKNIDSNKKIFDVKKLEELLKKNDYERMSK